MKLNFFVITIIVLLGALSAQTYGETSVKKFPQQPKVWPTQGWQENKADPQLPTLQALANYLFPSDASRETPIGVQTDGMIIVHGGKIVYERYREPYHVDKLHLSWSIAKSFLNALVGIAVKNGVLDIEDPVNDFVPVNVSDLPPIKLVNLLQMSSGIDWQETYENDPYGSNVIAMLFGSGRQDMGAYVAKVNQKYLPGSHWYYSSGDTNLLSKVLKVALGAKYEDYPWDVLFTPLGMGGVVFEQDGAGTFIGSSYMYATPRDYARFGFLFLHNGVWEGKQMLPENWVAFSTSLASGLGPHSEIDFGNYGAQWWLNKGDKNKGLEVAWSNAPEDMYGAFGHWGQSIVIIPSLDLVAVRTANDRDKTFDMNTYLGYLVPFVKALELEGGQ